MTDIQSSEGLRAGAGSAHPDQELPRLGSNPQVSSGRVIAILRADSSTNLLPVARVLAEEGISCIEVTLTTPHVLDAIAELAASLPGGVAIGAGTVTTPEQVRDVAAAGAQFIVSPCTSERVLGMSRELNLPSYPGALTPTEIFDAWQLGASAVKLFPASSVGPEYLRAIAGPLPQVPLIPTGGISLGSVAEFLSAGALAVGLGGPLIGDSLSGGSLEQLRARARRLSLMCSGEGSGE